MLCTLTVKGKDKAWLYQVDINPTSLKDQQADGVEIYELVNTIPACIPYWLVTPWCFIQDAFNFKWRTKCKTKS